MGKMCEHGLVKDKFQLVVFAYHVPLIRGFAVFIATCTCTCISYFYSDMVPNHKWNFSKCWIKR